MYIVYWDDYEGNQHQMEFEKLEDAVLESEALSKRDDVEFVSVGPADEAR